MIVLYYGGDTIYRLRPATPIHQDYISGGGIVIFIRAHVYLHDLSSYTLYHTVLHESGHLDMTSQLF